MLNDPPIAVQGPVRLYFHPYERDHRAAAIPKDRKSRALDPITLDSREAVLETRNSHQYVTLCKPRVPLTDTRPGPLVTAPVKLPNVYSTSLALNSWGAVVANPGLAFVTFNPTGHADVYKRRTGLSGKIQLKLAIHKSETESDGPREASFKLAKSCWIVAFSELKFEIWSCEPNNAVMLSRGALAPALEVWSQPQYPQFFSSVQILDCVFNPASEYPAVYVLIAHLHRGKWKELVLEVKFESPASDLAISRVLAVPEVQNTRGVNEQGYHQGALHFLGELNQALMVALPEKLCILFFDHSKPTIVTLLSCVDNSHSFVLNNDVCMVTPQGLVRIVLCPQDLALPGVSEDLVSLSRDLAIPLGFETPFYAPVAANSADDAVNRVISQLLSGLVPLYGVDPEHDAEPAPIEESLKLLQRLAVHQPHYTDEFTNAAEKLMSYIAAKMLCPDELTGSLDPVAESTFLAAASQTAFVPAIVEGIAVASSSPINSNPEKYCWFQSKTIQGAIANLKLSAAKFIETANSKDALIICEGLNKIKVATDGLAALERNCKVQEGSRYIAKENFEAYSSLVDECSTSSDEEEMLELIKVGEPTSEEYSECDLDSTNSLDSSGTQPRPQRESGHSLTGANKLDAYPPNDPGITDRSDSESNPEEIVQIWSSDDGESEPGDFEYTSDVDQSISKAVYGDVHLDRCGAPCSETQDNDSRVREKQVSLESDPDFVDSQVTDSECQSDFSESSRANSVLPAPDINEASNNQRKSQWLSSKAIVDGILDLVTTRLVQLGAHLELSAMILRYSSLEGTYASALAAAALDGDLKARGVIMERLSYGAYIYAEALFDCMISNESENNLFSEELSRGQLHDFRLRYLRTSSNVGKIALEAAEYFVALKDLIGAIRVLRHGLSVECDEHKALLLVKMLHRIGRHLDMSDIVYEAEYYALIIPTFPGLRARRDHFLEESASKDERVLLSACKVSCPFDCTNLAIALLVLPTDRFTVALLLRLAHKTQSLTIQRLTLQALVVAGAVDDNLLRQVREHEEVIFMPPGWSNQLTAQEHASLCAHLPEEAHRPLLKVLTNLNGACAARLQAKPDLVKELVPARFQVLAALD